MNYLRLISIALSIFMIGCKGNDNKDKKNKEVVLTTSKTEISITPLEDSPAYENAKLMLNTPETMVLPKAGEVDFKFELENYNLGEQTESINTQKLANSDKGQHIHFIVDNEPYSAHYEPEFKKELPEGVHHLVAFLSRSYHESVKNEQSVVVKKLMVGENPKDELGLEINTPTLIYSRPKGTYEGKDTDSLLLDFFVLNTELSETGTKVIATINDKKFTIVEWKPHVISGLPKGEVRIKLELVDAEGEVLPGPFNTVTRKVILKE